MQLYIKRIEEHGVEGYVLVDEAGEMLPFQMDGCLHSSADSKPTFTATFMAGKKGLQVIDERDD